MTAQLFVANAGSRSSSSLSPTLPQATRSRRVMSENDLPPASVLAGNEASRWIVLNDT